MVVDLWHGVVEQSLPQSGCSLNKVPLQVLSRYLMFYCSCSLSYRHERVVLLHPLLYLLWTYFLAQSCDTWNLHGTNSHRSSDLWCPVPSPATQSNNPGVSKENCQTHFSLLKLVQYAVGHSFEVLINLAKKNKIQFSLEWWTTMSFKYKFNPNITQPW